MNIFSIYFSQEVHWHPTIQYPSSHSRFISSIYIRLTSTSNSAPHCTLDPPLCWRFLGATTSGPLHPWDPWDPWDPRGPRVPRETWDPRDQTCGGLPWTETAPWWPLPAPYSSSLTLNPFPRTRYPSLYPILGTRIFVRLPEGQKSLGRSPPQQLEVSTRSRLNLLVDLK